MSFMDQITAENENQSSLYLTNQCQSVTCNNKNKTRGFKMTTPIYKRVGKHRKSLRAAGLRPIQIWVPDTRREGFAEECLRQSRLVSNDPQESEVMDWIENVSDREGWE